MKFESQYYDAIIEDGKVKFQTKDQVSLIENLHFSYSTCEIYNIRESLTNPQEIELDHTTDLHLGDSIIVTNNMYGCSARHTFWICATIVSIKKETHSISIDVSLPPHLMCRSTGLIVLKRTAYYDKLFLQNLQIQPSLGGACFLFDVSCDHFNMLVKIQMFEDSPHIEVQSKTTYLKDCQLFHQGIMIESPLALRELHLKNRVLRCLKSQEPQDDVWLWKEGCRAASPHGEWVIQHTPDIACIEVITLGRGFLWKSITPTKKPQVIVNLEHYQAQRFRQMIAYNGNFPQYKERSAPHYVKGDEINHTFRLFLGTKLPPVPRLMLTPGGFRAAHVWTEHADNTNTNSHRAAYYGNERITHAEEAVGGFVRYGHIVTKSIFYHNVRKYPSQASYNAYSEFRHFIDELSTRGHEICLHTAAVDEGPPGETHQALAEIAKRYKSPTWIDHNYTHIRTCVSYEGVVPHSPFCMLEAWRANDCYYFWHSASEDFAPMAKDGIDLLHNNSGDYTPTPLYWRVSAMPEDMITWAANECPLEYYKEEVIDDLIKNRGISIHHHYYPYLEGVGGAKTNFNFIEKDLEQRYVATQAFNDVLSLMALRKDIGELYFTTIGEIVSYWLAIECIQIELCIPDGFILINTRDQGIKGLAFVIHADQVECLEAPIQSRCLDNGDILVWCDMPAGGRYQFSVKPHSNR